MDGLRNLLKAVVSPLALTTFTNYFLSFFLSFFFFSFFCGWQSATTTIMKLFFEITALSDPLGLK